MNFQNNQSTINFYNEQMNSNNLLVDDIDFLNQTDKESKIVKGSSCFKSISREK